ncbi:hypothetical protein ACLB1M_33810 [Escherichia coli]
MTSLPSLGITSLILNGDKIADEVCISILNWLWEKDEALLSEAPLLSQQALIRFSTKITDDRQKQALLMQCLKNDGGSHKFIRQVLMTFGHQDYAAFLTERNYRSIPVVMPCGNWLSSWEIVDLSAAETYSR